LQTFATKRTFPSLTVVLIPISTDSRGYGLNYVCGANMALIQEKLLKIFWTLQIAAGIVENSVRTKMISE
jgi:hypothetical protein